jgi:hypothetical protein
MEPAVPLPVLPKILGIVAAVLGASGWTLILTSQGSDATQRFLTGVALFAPGLVLAVFATVLGAVKKPRSLVIPVVSLLINVLPIVVFVFFASVLAGMQG